jgi:hypothetical protein
LCKWKEGRARGDGIKQQSAFYVQLKAYFKAEEKGFVDARE